MCVKKLMRVGEQAGRKSGQPSMPHATSLGLIIEASHRLWVILAPACLSGISGLPVKEEAVGIQNLSRVSQEGGVRTGEVGPD